MTVGLEDLNFFGGARRLDVKSTFSGFLTQPAKYQTTRLEGDLIQPYLFGTRWDARANLSEEWRKREAYDSDATTLRTSLDRRLNSLLWLSLRYRFSGTRLKRASAEAQTAGFTNVSAAGPSLRYDTTDDPFLPRNGWRLIGSFEEGLEFGPGDVGFHKYEGRAGRFDTVGGWTFFEGAQGGLIQPRSGKSDDIIPIYERYFLGGANSVRGYPERQLGPKDVDGKPLGGTSFMVGNFEIRRRIYKALFSVVFLDAGQLFTSAPANPDSRARLKGIDDLAYGAGGGLRLHSPIGAIRLELGYQLRPQGGTKFRDRTAVHFSVGEVF